jgi:hypothetical protein
MKEDVFDNYLGEINRANIVECFEENTLSFFGIPLGWHLIITRKITNERRR